MRENYKTLINSYLVKTMQLVNRNNAIKMAKNALLINYIWKNR